MRFNPEMEKDDQLLKAENNAGTSSAIQIHEFKKGFFACFFWFLPKKMPEN